MRPSNWLNKLKRNERGNVLAIGAATMPLLMASAGFAIDTMQIAFWNRQVQRAADSAALAGAHARTQEASTDVAVSNDIDEHIDYDLDANETPTLIDRVITVGSFGQGTLSTTQKCEEREIDGPCHDKAVQVELTAERRLPFMSIFTGATTRITARATAAVVNSGKFCLISLYEGTDPGIIAGGNSDIDLDCGMVTNARGDKAINAYGSATIDSDPAGAVGNIYGRAKFTKGTTILPYGAPVVDPFAHVPDPVLPSCEGTIKITDGTAETPVKLPPNSPGCYANWEIKGHLKLDPGTYYINNGTLDINGSVTGENVTLVMMGDDSNWTQSGGGKLSLTAPESGPYKGIVIFRERTAISPKDKPIKLNGGADLFLKGAIYGKNTDIWIGGNADIQAECLQIVGRTLEFKGGGSIKNNCSGMDYGAFETGRVRLVL
jgi:hypothetical protein